ncbi:putative Tic20 family protein [Acinetobacter bereziniae]|uniref:hypothetical protein n=1 Tax=Acinetobacter bereziniae TaxID=106648 RepID=UPI00285FE9DB|nr:hypothetical protein [Acinetobacter bereziniae]MDR6543959.1 putative Tic20 family protein [Acinetobacter bereziniae]
MAVIKYSFIALISFIISLLPIYYAKTTGDFNDYCITGPEITYTTCQLDIGYVSVLTTCFTIILFIVFSLIYLILETVFKYIRKKN